MPKKSLNDPRIKKTNRKDFDFSKKSNKSHCFVNHLHFDPTLAYKTYIKSKISIRDFDCPYLTSVSLLGCPFVPKQDTVLGIRCLTIGVFEIIICS